MCCFDGFIKYSYFQSIVMGSSIRYYGRHKFIAGNYYYYYYVAMVVVVVVAVVVVLVVGVIDV